MRSNFTHIIKDSDKGGQWYVMHGHKIQKVFYSKKQAKIYIEALGRHK